MWLLRQFCIFLCLPLFVILIFQIDVVRLFPILRKLHKSDLLPQQLRSGSCWNPSTLSILKILSFSFTGQATIEYGWCSVMCFELNCYWKNLSLLRCVKANMKILPSYVYMTLKVNTQSILYWQAVSMSLM